MLPTVVSKDSSPHYISPALTAFEERRKLGFGHFISEAELRKNDQRGLPELLERIPGLRSVEDPFTHKIRMASGRAIGDASHGSFRDNGKPTPCYITVYIDGIRDAYVDDFRRLNIDQFAGVEFYEGAATMPAEFNTTGSGCGVLLLWTRER